MRYFVYDKATGLFTGATILGDDPEVILANTPVGCAVITGDVDMLSQQVQVSGPQHVIVPYQPPSPGEGYEWNEDTKRWLRSPAAQQAVDADAAARAGLAAIDAASIRALREAAIGDKAAAITKLQELEDEAVVLRVDVVSAVLEAGGV